MQRKFTKDFNQELKKPAFQARVKAQVDEYCKSKPDMTEEDKKHYYIAAQVAQREAFRREFWSAKLPDVVVGEHLGVKKFFPWEYRGDIGVTDLQR